MLDVSVSVRSNRQTARKTATQTNTRSYCVPWIKDVIVVFGDEELKPSAGYLWLTDANGLRLKTADGKYLTVKT